LSEGGSLQARRGAGEPFWAKSDFVVTAVLGEVGLRGDSRPLGARGVVTRCARVSMVPPPWRIVSPTGVIHVVVDDKALRALATVGT
jgi:hypothetical protein